MEENRGIKIVQERNMTFFQELTSNQTLMTGVTGWVVAQVLKTILDIGLNHSFNPELIHCMFAGNGGGAAVRSGKL